MAHAKAITDVGPDPAQDIIVSVGFQADGVTYRLHPKSAQRVASAFPGVLPAPSVFVGYTTQADFRSLHGPMWPHVLTILAGVGPDRLKTLGRVVFWNTMTGETWEVA